MPILSRSLDEIELLASSLILDISFTRVNSPHKDGVVSTLGQARNRAIVTNHVSTLSLVVWSPRISMTMPLRLRAI